jgi:BirA family transcriptional regulator, biotin operon repressor / biotin---[acetyl-CoA-carboxylase] ligase
MTLGPLRQDWRVTDWLPELQVQEPGLRVDMLSETGSTNADLMSMARSGQLHPQVRVAERQTQGRGRLGRVWQSQDGASLTVSVGLLMSPQDWSGLSLVVGTVLAQALEPQHQAGSPRLALKWPNDLWLREPLDGAAEKGIGRKLGGILIETLPTTADARWCVIGMGLNIAPQVVEGAQTGVACLQELDARWTAPLALQTLMPPLWAALRRFEREGFAPWQTAFNQRDLLRDQAVTTTLRQVPQGRAVGVDGQGGLRVLDAQGQVHTVVGGEVSIRLATS